MRIYVVFTCLVAAALSQAETARLVEGARPVPPYTLDRRLGSNDRTEVWRARRSDGSALALKFVPVDSAQAFRATQETRTLLALEKLTVNGLLVAETAWAIEGYLVFPMVLATDTLAERQERARRPLWPDELLPVVASVATTLDALGAVRSWRGLPVRGVAHRDVKPDNIFFVEEEALLGDVEWIVPMSNFGNHGYVPAGTPGYAPPEFYHGEVTVRSDQFSLAATYAAMRLGRFPFPRPPLRFEGGWKPDAPVMKELPSEERRVLLRALSIDPTQRFRSCSAFVEELGLAVSREREPV